MESIPTALGAYEQFYKTMVGVIQQKVNEYCQHNGFNPQCIVIDQSILQIMKMGRNTMLGWPITYNLDEEETTLCGILVIPTTQAGIIALASDFIS